MEVQIRHSPSYAVAKALLNPHEKLKAQPGSMMAMSYGVDIQAKADGGVMRGIGRMLSGENFHVTTFTAPAEGGWVDLIPETVGDVFVTTVENHNPLLLSSGAWLGNDMGLDVKPDMSLSSRFSGESWMVLKAVGQGTLIGSTYGAIDVHSLPPGVGFTIDTGHLVAWESSVQMNVRKASGWMASWKSKEGLVVDVVGPGDVITQSRVPRLMTQAATNNNNFGISFG